VDVDAEAEALRLSKFQRRLQRVVQLAALGRLPECAAVDRADLMIVLDRVEILDVDLELVEAAIEHIAVEHPLLALAIETVEEAAIRIGKDVDELRLCRRLDAQACSDDVMLAHRLQPIEVLALLDFRACPEIVLVAGETQLGVVGAENNPPAREYLIDRRLATATAALDPVLSAFVTFGRQLDRRLDILD